MKRRVREQDLTREKLLADCLCNDLVRGRLRDCGLDLWTRRDLKEMVANTLRSWKFSLPDNAEVCKHALRKQRPVQRVLDRIGVSNSTKEELVDALVWALIAECFKEGTIKIC